MNWGTYIGNIQTGRARRRKDSRPSCLTAGGGLRIWCWRTFLWRALPPSRGNKDALTAFIFASCTQRWPGTLKMSFPAVGTNRRHLHGVAFHLRHTSFLRHLATGPRLLDPQPSRDWNHSLHIKRWRIAFLLHESHVGFNNDGFQHGWRV